MIYIFYIFAHRGKESEKRAKKHRGTKDAYRVTEPMVLFLSVKKL